MIGFEEGGVVDIVDEEDDLYDNVVMYSVVFECSYSTENSPHLYACLVQKHVI